MKKDTLVVGFVYPGIELYMEDYLKSIWAQTYKNFDLFLGDGRDIIGSRREVIWHAWENYKYIVWTDCDDWFSPNRVELSRETLEEGFDFVYNEIVPAWGGVEFVPYKPRLLLQEWGIESNILDRNIYGLSNTAVKAKLLRDIRIPPDIIALDWWIYTNLLLRGYTGGFIKNATSFYRQHGNNTVGFGKALDEKRLNRGVGVKASHYDHLGFKDKFNQINILGEKLKDDVFRAKYIKVINKNMDKIYNGWWSEILPLHEWEKYNV